MSKNISTILKTKWLDDFGVPNSVYPCTKHLTFGPWIYLVPQYKPESVLILGYAGGTVAGLIRLLYGDIPITAVDIKHCDSLYNVDFVLADAKEYVKTCKHYDTVIVDLSEDDKKGICGFVTSKEFADNLARIANYICINTYGNVDMSVYKLKCAGVNKPSGLANKIYYYQTKEIPELHVF